MDDAWLALHAEAGHISEGRAAVAASHEEHAQERQSKVFTHVSTNHHNFRGCNPYRDTHICKYILVRDLGAAAERRNQGISARIWFRRCCAADHARKLFGGVIQNGASRLGASRLFPVIRQKL